MEQVDRWVLKTVAHELQRSGASATVLVSVNLSSAAIGSSSFVQFVRELFSQYGVQAASFCFEIPEHGVWTQLDHVKALVERLHELGAQVALGIETVAMAVECPSLVEDLRGFGVDYAQGFATHRPESWPPIWDKAFTKPQIRSNI